MPTQRHTSLSIIDRSSGTTNVTSSSSQSSSGGKGTEITGTVTHKKEFQDLNHRLSLLLSQQQFLLDMSDSAGKLTSTQAGGIDNAGLNAFLLQVEEDNRKLVARRAENDANILALKKDQERLLATIEDLKARLLAAQGDASNFRAEAGSALSQVRGLEAEINRLKAELQKRIVGGDNTELERLKAALQRERTEHEKTKQRWANEKRLLEQDIAGLKQEVGEQKKINLMMNANYMADKANFEMTQTKCRELQLQMQGSATQQSTWKEELQREYEQLFNKHKQELSDDLEEYKNSLKTQYSKELRSVEKIDWEFKTDGQVAKYKQMVASLRAEVATYAEKLQQSVLQLAHFKQKIGSSDSDAALLNQLREAKSRLELSCEGLRAKLAAAHDKIRQMEFNNREDMKLKDDEIAGLRAHIQDILNRLQASQANAISLKSEFRVYRQMLKEGEHILDMPFPDRKRRRKSSIAPNLEISTFNVAVGYVVLYNGTSGEKSLNGWSLKTADGRHTVQLPTITVNRGGTFKILTQAHNRNKDQLKRNEMLWAVDLENTELMLCNRRGDVVDTLPISASSTDAGTWNLSGWSKGWWNKK